MADEEIGLRDVLSFASDFLGVVVPAAELAAPLLRWITSEPSAPDPILAAMQKIDDGFSRIEDLTLATWASLRQDNLAFLRAHSTAALQTVNEFVQSNGDPSSPQWATRLALADNDSLLAVDTFVGEIDAGFWRRPESNAVISQNGDPTDIAEGWMPYIEDRADVDAFGQVWDYRWGLPAAIYAISVRIAVLKITGVSNASWQRELRRYDVFTGKVAERMRGGIRSLDALTPAQINDIPTHGTVPIAAADINGGYFIGGLFDISFRPFLFTRVPFPQEVIVPTFNRLDLIEKDCRTLTSFWRDEIATRMCFPQLFAFSGAIENLLNVVPPPPTHPPQPPHPRPAHKVLFYGGNGPPGEITGLQLVGVLFGVTADGDLHWYRYQGSGASDATGSIGWDDNSGNRIGNGWQDFTTLLGAGDGVIISIDRAGDMRWHRYLGSGEDDVSGSHWHANSGNRIGSGWNRFRLVFITPATPQRAMVIYAISQNGDLLWYSYAGDGAEDASGSLGWHENSGNRIGSGWLHVLRLHGSGNVIFAVNESGDLLWYSYVGNGQDDVSGASNWHPNSGNAIGNGWRNFLAIFGGASDVDGGGHVLYAVDENRDLLWHRYEGDGRADESASTGWNENSGHPIGNGW